MSVNDIRDFIFENNYKQITFSKENRNHLMKRLKKKTAARFVVAFKQINEKIPDPRNVKEHDQSFIRKENTKSINQSQITTYQLNTFDIVDIKSVITEHPKT